MRKDALALLFLGINSEAQLLSFMFIILINDIVSVLAMLCCDISTTQHQLLTGIMKIQQVSTKIIQHIMESSI